MSTVFANKQIPFGAVRIPGTSPLAVRAGSWVFFSTLAGTDPETGLILSDADDLPQEARAFLEDGRHIDAMEWPVVAQTWGIFQNFERGLREFGGTLDNLVRTNTFYGHFYDFVAFERTRAGFLKQAPPASSVMETGWKNVDPRVRVLMHGWAVLPGGEDGFVKSAISSQNVAAAAAHFSLAIQAGPLIWPSGQVGKHPETEEYLLHWSGLPVDVPWLKNGNRHLDHREGPMAVQAWLTYENLRRIIAERGCTLDDILFETIYVRDIDYLPALDRVRRQLWPDPSKAPATTVVQVSDLGVTPRAMIEIDIVALEPGNSSSWRREATLEVNGIHSAVHGPVSTKAGPFVFVAGQHGLLDNGRPANNLAELKGGARALHTGHVYAERPAEAQTWLVYDRLKQILESQNATLEHLVKVNAYFDDAADIPAFQRVGAAALGGTPHATATIPVKRAGRTEQHTVVADGIGYVG